MQALGDDLAKVVRPVATNPTADPSDESAGEPGDPDTTTPIRHPAAKLWAHLFNVRYRKLLVSLSHAFELADDPSDRVALSPRGGLIHRAFAEMYQLRAIAGLLVELPVDDADPDSPRAGPPFQMPYTLMLPHSERDRWRLHRDLLDATARLIQQLREPNGPDGTGVGQDYLVALAQCDEIERGQLDQLIGGLIAGSADAGSAPAPALSGGPLR